MNDITVVTSTKMVERENSLQGLEKRSYCEQNLEMQCLCGGNNKMPKVQIYEDDKEAMLFDGHLTITFELTGYRFNTGFSKGAITRILNRMGYMRKGKWITTTCGWEAWFKRK